MYHGFYTRRLRIVSRRARFGAEFSIGSVVPIERLFENYVFRQPQTQACGLRFILHDFRHPS